MRSSSTHVRILYTLNYAFPALSKVMASAMGLSKQEKVSLKRLVIFCFCELSYLLWVGINSIIVQCGPGADFNPLKRYNPVLLG